MIVKTIKSGKEIMLIGKDVPGGVAILQPYKKCQNECDDGLEFWLDSKSNDDFWMIQPGETKTRFVCYRNRDICANFIEPKDPKVTKWLEANL